MKRAADREMLVRKSYYIQEVLLCVLLDLLLLTPMFILTLTESDLILSIVFSSCAVLSLITITALCFGTKKNIIFTKNEIKIIKGKKSRTLKWQDTEINYLGMDYIIFLKCFTVELTYYDASVQKQVGLLIPSSRKRFLEIMNLRSSVK